MSAYDVIVIGSGAGGGTLAQASRRRGSASCCSSGATGCRASRRTGRRATCSSTTATCPRTRGTTPRASPSSHRSTTTSAAPPRCTAPRCTACAQEDFGELHAPRRHLAAWPIGYDDARALLHRGRAALPGARRARRGPDRAARQRALPVPRGVARAAHPATRRRPRGGRPSPVPRPLRRHARRERHALQPLRPLRTATASRASCTPSPTPRCWRAAGARARERDAADERRGVRLETDAAGSTVTGVVVQRGGNGRRDLHRRHRRGLLRRRQLRPAAAGLGERRAPGRPRQRVRPGRAQLHVPQQPGRARAVQGREPDGVPEDPRRQRLLLRRRRRRSYPLGNIQMVGKSVADMFRGEKPLQTRLAPQLSLEEIARHAIDFWLSTEDLPSPENRVTLDADGQRQAELHADQRGAQARALPPPQGDARPPRDGPAPSRAAPHVPEERDPRGGLCAPGGYVPVRLRPRDLGARHRLPRARGRQPLRRRHELLPEHRRGQPGADRDGERAAGRRPPAGAPA